jgi:hypothetical protein
MTSLPPFGRHPPSGPRWKPAPQPPSTLMIMLSGPWPGASGAACAAPPDTPKMKASAIILFTLFLPALPSPHRIMAPASSRRKEGIDIFLCRSGGGIDAAEALPIATSIFIGDYGSLGTKYGLHSQIDSGPPAGRQVVDTAIG